MNIHITRLMTWLQCKRRGQFANLYEPKSEPEWAQTGSQVHSYLAHLTDPCNFPYPKYLNEFSRSLGDHYFMWLQDNTSYSNKKAPTDKWLYKNEVPFTVPWLHTKHYMQGHIDSIVYDVRTGERYLLEYKTTTNIDLRAEQVLNEIQPIWYVLAAQKMGYQIDKIVYHLLRKKVPNLRRNADTTKYWQKLVGQSQCGDNSQNYFAQVIIPISRYDLTIWEQQLAVIIDEYTKCISYYPTFGYHCKWCPFSTVCNLMQRANTQDHARALLELNFRLRAKGESDENLQ